MIPINRGRLAAFQANLLPITLPFCRPHMLRRPGMYRVLDSLI